MGLPGSGHRTPLHMRAGWGRLGKACSVSVKAASGHGLGCANLQHAWVYRIVDWGTCWATAEAGMHKKTDLRVAWLGLLGLALTRLQSPLLCLRSRPSWSCLSLSI